MSTELVPILDIRRFDRSDDPRERAGFVRELNHAYREIGFVAVSHHGIPDAVIADAYRAIKAFFDLPLEQKLAYRVGKGGARGYTPFGVEHAKDSPAVDLKEFWHVGREHVPGAAWTAHYPPNIWPTEIPGFREATWALYQQLEALGDRVLRAVALGLDLDERYFEDKTDHGNSILRPIHYPPLAPGRGDPGSVRSGQHEDINLITLLIGSGEPGLEVLSRAGQWVPVTTIPEAIVVNVGDMLQRLTNDVLRSTTHRVVNPPSPYAEVPRYSIPFFLHPNSEFSIESLSSCVTPDNPNHYPEPITADQYLTQRLIEIGLLPSPQK
ncbi:isopenicillin N synthase family dioxygenase [Nannocystis pusilla]|uniref:isopenicillin N synthase family dioxygenase n=1 Tax=Nannocystis pusilla TaxID=889268 RepID=UPI003BF1A1EB